MQERAGGERSWPSAPITSAHNGPSVGVGHHCVHQHHREDCTYTTTSPVLASSTSLAYKSEPEADFVAFRRRMQARTAQWGSKDPTNAGTTFPTSQYCTAVSFDIRNAIARFPGWFECCTRARVGIPPGFVKPLP